MRVIGFGFDKISAEKIKEPGKDTKVSTNIDVLDIKEVKADIFNAKDEVLQITFSYLVKYEPSIANVEFKGKIHISMTKSEAEPILKDWKKKGLPDAVKIPLFNFIFKRANVKALGLEEEVNLPLHIPLPRLVKEKDK